VQEPNLYQSVRIDAALDWFTIVLPTESQYNLSEGHSIALNVHNSTTPIPAEGDFVSGTLSPLLQTSDLLRSKC